MSDPRRISDPELPEPGSDVPPAREGRPSGEAGGHTVQDWEHPPPGRTLSEAAHAPSPEANAAAHAPVDEPSPPTVPLYLRASAGTALAGAAAAMPVLEARTRIVTAQSAAIVDAMTRELAEALAESLRPVIASTVVALLPMILSLGSIPEDEWPEAARPPRPPAVAAPRPKPRK